jgi:hypothetical protein
MTEDQRQHLESYLNPIRRELASLTLPEIPLDGFEANQTIATFRHQIAMLDIAIFGAFRILASFHNETYVKIPKKQKLELTIDDL